MGQSDNHTSHSQTVRQQVFALLDKNPLLTAKPLCQLLKIPYNRYRDYVAHLKSKWKYDYKFRLGSSCPFPRLHHVRAVGFVPVSVVRDLAVGVGWVLSRNRNRCLLWRVPGLGRVEWWESGRVHACVVRPQTMGRVKQLLFQAFFNTGLIFDMKVMDDFLGGVHWKSGVSVFETSERLPYKVIDDFVRSNGIRILLGDASHPNAVEVEWAHPDWAERHELLLDRLMEALGLNGQTKGVAESKGKMGYVA